MTGGNNAEGDAARPDQPELEVDDLLAGVIAIYLDQEVAGAAPQRARLLEEHPELADELKSFFADHDRLRHLAGAAGTGGGLPLCGGSSPPLDPTEDVSGRAVPTAETGAQTARQFGDFELLEEIARGGMGVVYRARQVSLNRIVAVKMTRAGPFAAPEDLQRFRCEAEAAAGLQHPNIVKIHAVGEYLQQPFFAMEYVEGRNLSEILREGPLAAKRAARYVLEIAQAIDYAHQHGVLHRDLKPSNVLIDAFDHVRVTDFGLAKRIAADDKLTVTGQLLGTPQYMSPEQVSGDTRQITAASDIFSLGALLYHLVTGRPPFEGSTPLEILQEVREVDPVLPQRLNAQVPRELAMISLKCLEKDPLRRYPSAQALADDLDRFLRGDPISIASMSLFERLSRNIERSHHDVELRTWGDMALWVGAIVIVTHCAIFTLASAAAEQFTFWHRGLRGFEIVAISLVLWLYRRRWYPPRGMPARQCWAIWLGYVSGSAILVAVRYLARPEETLLHELTLYPQFAVLVSMGLFVLGSSYWGYCHIMAAAFLLLALAMAHGPIWAPLVFGGALGLCFVILGRHLNRLQQTADIAESTRLRASER